MQQENIDKRWTIGYSEELMGGVGEVKLEKQSLEQEKKGLMLILKVGTFYNTMENYSKYLRQGRLLSLKSNINLAFWQQCIKQIN